jgi:2-oxoglutarate ferredoxin oxidoreductase subunit alpha
LAEKYLNPVIILSDGTVGQTEEEVILPPTGYIPIIDRENNESRFHTTGLYTGTNRLPTKNPEVSGAQLERILAKLASDEAKNDILKTDQFLIEDPQRDGLASGKAKVVVVSFGITARAAEEAVLLARKEGLPAGLLRPITIWPSDEKTIKSVLSNAETVIVAELNCGQYIEEIKRLGYEMAVEYQKVPPQIVGLNIIEGRRTASTSLISADEILNRIREFKGEG